MIFLLIHIGVAILLIVTVKSIQQEIDDNKRRKAQKEFNNIADLTADALKNMKSGIDKSIEEMEGIKERLQNPVEITKIVPDNRAIDGGYVDFEEVKD
jgi:hypothetical protein